MVEAERYAFALETLPNPEFLRGYRAGSDHAFGILLDDVKPNQTSAQAFVNTTTTWGLQATKVDVSSKTGRGIRVAVLDTGLHMPHPDFNGRLVTAKSFVAGQTSTPDVVGHGTHCCGTVCGPRRLAGGVGYGCAPDVELFFGKVLNNQGQGRDGDILAGIDWAVANGVNIISMSLGAPAMGSGFSMAYETAAARGLLSQAGTIIVAAAGNESRRPGAIQPVGSPANCPSIVSVGAVDSQMSIGFFSCGGLFPPAGAVDLVGPGVDVLSSFPNPNYRSLMGTSMATPHVAGIAALWSEATQQRGRMLINVLLQNCKSLPGLASDFGSGLVQAPA